MSLPDPHATLDNCRYCLMCRHADPLGYVTHDESLTPHGIALAVASVRRGLLDWNEATLHNLYAEVDAGVARAHCVTDQPFSEAVAAVRAEVVAAGLAPERVYALRAELERVGSLWPSVAFAAEKGRSHDAKGNGTGAIPVTSAGSTAAPASGPLEGGQGASKATLALLVGDEAPYLRPASVTAAERLLEALGTPFARLGVGRSAGFMAASLGFRDLARAQAQALLDELEGLGATRVVTLGPGDAYTLSRLYPERLGVPWPGTVDVVELTTLVEEAEARGALALEPTAFDAPYAYVDPTQALRRAERVETPRALLDRFLGGERRELFWSRGRAHPVGNTALRFTHPELAERLTRARLDDARRRGVKHLVCDDPSTLHEIARFAHDAGLEAHGLYEILERRVTSRPAPSAP